MSVDSTTVTARVKARRKAEKLEQRARDKAIRKREYPWGCPDDGEGWHAVKDARGRTKGWRRKTRSAGHPQFTSVQPCP